MVHRVEGVALGPIHTETRGGQPRIPTRVIDGRGVIEPQRCPRIGEIGIAADRNRRDRRRHPGMRGAGPTTGSIVLTGIDR